MYREIITPNTEEITLKIPSAYLNKKLEVLVFEINEGMATSPIHSEKANQPPDALSAQMKMAETIMADNADVLEKLAQ